MVEKVPRLRRLPVFGFFLREYKRYSPDFSFRIISPPQYSLIEMIAGKERAAFRMIRVPPTVEAGITDLVESC
jgi:hypothetical protein